MCDGQRIAALEQEIERQAQSIAYWIQSAAEWTDRKMTLDERAEKAEQEVEVWKQRREEALQFAEADLRARLAAEQEAADYRTALEQMAPSSIAAREALAKHRKADA